MRVNLERLDRVTTLYAGAHQPDGKMCVMEAAAYVAGEPWSDAPACVSPTIADFLRRWNDALQDDATRLRLLKPLIPVVIGSRTTLADENARAWMLVDWLARAAAPAMLRLPPRLVERAERLMGLRKGWIAFSAVTIGARDAAWDAAAAEAAAEAGAVLGPTIITLQSSACDLVRAMAAYRVGGDPGR